MSFEAQKGTAQKTVGTPRFDVQRARELLPDPLVDSVLNGQKLVVVLGASGDNARRFSKGLEAQGLLIAAVGRRKVENVGAIAIPPALQFATKDEEDRARLDSLLDSGIVSTVYDSTIPEVRLANFRDLVLPHMQSGRLDRYVTTKPVGISLREYLVFQNDVKAVTSDEGDQADLTERFFIHEHYLAKGPWVALREHLGEATEKLGRLTHMSVSIQEALTAEEQHREDAYKGGGLQDYGPHIASLYLDVRRIINSQGRYQITNYTETVDEDTPLLATVRYVPTSLPTDIDTGFEVQAKSSIIDTTLPDGHNEHELQYEWMAGKGLVDKKLVTLDFVNPDTSERSSIIVDLQNNTITAPDSVKHLFNDSIFDDNGYGERTAGGLNGTDPKLVFQGFGDAMSVAVWEESLRQKSAKQHPIEYPLQELRVTPVEELVA